MNRSKFLLSFLFLVIFIFAFSSIDAESNPDTTNTILNNLTVGYEEVVTKSDGNFTLTFYHIGDIGSQDWIISVQNQHLVNEEGKNKGRYADLSSFISKTNFNTDEVENLQFHEWKPVLHTDEVAHYNYINHSEYLYDETNNTYYWNNWTESVFNYTETVEYEVLEWKACKSLILKKDLTELKDDYGDILIPQLGSKDAGKGTVNGTKIFRLTYDTPIVRTADGWGSSGEFAMLVDGVVFCPYWNTTYTGRLPITVTTNGTSTPAYYQVLVNISTIPDGMNESFLGIAFTNSSHETELSYWIEYRVNGSYANIWINLSDAISHPGSDTIWMYYGSAGLSDGGGISSTFIVGDDGESGTPSGDWLSKATGTIVCDSGLVKSGSYSLKVDVGATASSGVYLPFSNRASGILEYDMRVITTVDSIGGGLYDNSHYIGTNFVYRDGANEFQYFDTAYKPVCAASIDTWYKIMLVAKSTSQYDIYVNGDLKISNTLTRGSPANYNRAFVGGFHIGGIVYIDNLRVRKYIANEPTYSIGTAQHYTNSLHYNTTTPYNITIESDGTLTSNRSIITTDDTNWAANSTDTTYWQHTTTVTPAGYSNFTISGGVLDNFTATNLTASTQYDLKNSSGTVEQQTTNANGNATFEVDLVAGDYWIEHTGFSIVLLSQTPSIIYQNSTGYLNISYGITHSSAGLNNTSVSFIFRGYDYDCACSNHSIRVPSNNLAAEWDVDGRILRGINRNETLNFENNATITGGDIYSWSGMDENSTGLTIVPVNSTYTLVYLNKTMHCFMPQMWYLDRSELRAAPKTQLPIHKNQNVLIKFWELELFKGNTDFLGVGYTDTSLNSNSALWPSDANPVNYYYVNSSYDPATGGAPITSGYAVYMGSKNASGWVDHVWSPHTNSQYTRGFIDNNHLNTIIDTTNISYVYFTSNTESSKPYYLNMTNVASSTNISFANTNVLWAGNNPPFTPQSYTPNVWFSFMKLNMSLDHKLYAADNNDLWGSSSMNRTNITQALFPPTTPMINHFHFLGETDYDMDGVYYGNFSIGCAVSSDPDGGDVTHNLTLHYDNETFVAIINNTFTNKDITHNGVYHDSNFSSIPYYSDDVNYTLRLIATDDESESVTVWLNKNFTLSITPIITSYTPSTPVTTIQHDTQEFTINISQIVNVTWYIDGSVVSTVNNTNYSTYSNSTAPIDIYIVTAHVENVNGTRQQVWEWNVEDPIYSALIQLQADIDDMKKVQTIIQALILLVIGVVVGVVSQRRRYNDEDSEKPIESKNN